MLLVIILQMLLGSVLPSTPSSTEIFQRFMLPEYRELANVSGVYPRDYVPFYNDTRPSLRIGYLTGSRGVPGDNLSKWRGKQISGAITLAVDEINRSPDILPGHILEFLAAETLGKEEISIAHTAALPLKYNISAYIGPQETCIHEGRIAAAFNLPMISFVSIDLLLILMFKYRTI